MVEVARGELSSAASSRKEVRMMEIIHRTKDGILFHTRYTKEKGTWGWTWRKIYGSEEPCDCSDREEDRKALLEIKATDRRILLG